MHAGGVLIAPGRLTDFCPLYKAPGTDSVISQYDKDDVEAVGLVKFDFLGLRNLTIIDLADPLREPAPRRPRASAALDLSTLAFDDAKAYQILKDGNTVAIFQVESDGMKKLLRKLQPDRFEDIIAVLALYRPGSARLRHGRRLHPQEARPAEDRLLSSEPARVPGADLRRDRLPGAGDADRADHRRLHAGRRRPAAPRDGQEEGLGNGAAAPDLHGRRQGARPGRRTSRPSCST